MEGRVRPEELAGGGVVGYELVTLANGARSIRSSAAGETFHPVIGPQAEAQRLYVEQLGVPGRVRARAAEGRTGSVIWDVGMGAAGNVLTLLSAMADVDGEASVISFDNTVAPLEFGLGRAAELGYYAGFEAACGDLLRSGEARFSSGALRVWWKLCLGDFPDWVASGTQAGAGVGPPLAILYDAFSPARNPEMWTLAHFRALHARLDPGTPCALATYSRSTLLRVTLLLAGFYVGRGRSTGEKEETTIAANALELIEEPLEPSWLDRVRRSTSAQPLLSPTYRQAPLSAQLFDELCGRPQFRR